MTSSFGHLAARPAEPADDDFLAQLYASTRADLLHIPVPREVVDAIIRHQQQLQGQGYAASFPRAQYLVLEHLGAPVGRLVLNEGAGELRVVDISIMPRERRRGHARAVLLSLQERARACSAALTLRVHRHNLNARALYASMGFVAISGDEVSEQMRWTPGGQAQNAQKE
jgi:ribosomal protein S18 acetylase RimI-like enzyme